MFNCSETIGWVVDIVVDRLAVLKELEEETRSCRKCGLFARRQNVVFADGNPASLLMLVGEGPGGQEDETGTPFVGPAGQLLNRVLEAAGIKRADVYIANVVKCRPPGNRLPLPAEVAACRSYLEAQIALVTPRIIVCLGSLATKTLIDPGTSVTAARGSWVSKEGMLIMPTFHPAALLRDPAKKRPVWEDFQQVRDAYRRLI